MPLVTSRTQLNQGSVLAVSDAVFGAPTGNSIAITSVGAGLPSIALNEFFEVRSHSLSSNNGLYIATGTPTNSSISCDKVFGNDPVAAASEAVITLGNTGVGTEKSIFFDVAVGGIAILEKGNVDAFGVEGKAMYSFVVQIWKDDDFIIANAPFPMLSIDTDAGKFIIGQDINGNNSGWNWLENATYNIRTRKLLRNTGWDEVDSIGNTTARSFCVKSVDAVEDPVNDIGFIQFGTDTTVDNTVDLDFAGAANQAIEFFKEQIQTNLAMTATTITRVGGSFITEGYKVGGQITIRNANNAANNGTFVISAVTALVITTSGLTIDATDATAILAVDNSNAVRLGMRIRDGDANGKFYAEADLNTIAKTSLGNFIFQFPMATATDLNIAATDATIDGSLPYTGMSLTFFAAPQPRTNLVGGSQNFGIIGDANGGTNTQFFEWLQRQLRKLTDIDAGVGTNIGRALKLMARFNGAVLELGSPDGGLSFAENPEGGGTGMYVDNLSAASANSTKYWDNTGTLRAAPESVPTLLDFNQIAIDDVTTEYDLFYDRTIRTTVGDLVLTSGTSRLTSAGTSLPTNAQIAVTSYVRLEGMSDVTMDGVYQITAINTPGADWSIVRYDGKTLVTTTAASVFVDQNCIDTPDNIIVHTDIINSASTIAFNDANPDTITDSANGFGSFAAGDKVEVEGSTSNDGIYEVASAAAGSLVLDVTELLTIEAAGAAVTITKIVSGIANADVSFSYAFDSNQQGGRTVSTETFVKAKAIGSTGAQYIASTVQSIASGGNPVIPLSSSTERNFA